MFQDDNVYLHYCLGWCISSCGQHKSLAQRRGVETFSPSQDMFHSLKVRQLAARFGLNVGINVCRARDPEKQHPQILSQ